MEPNVLLPMGFVLSAVDAVVAGVSGVAVPLPDPLLGTPQRNGDAVPTVPFVARPSHEWSLHLIEPPMERAHRRECKRWVRVLYELDEDSGICVFRFRHAVKVPDARSFVKQPDV